MRLNGRYFVVPAILVCVLSILAAAVVAAWIDSRTTRRIETALADEQYGVPESLVEACGAHQFVVRRDGQPDHTFDYRLFEPVMAEGGQASAAGGLTKTPHDHRGDGARPVPDGSVKNKPYPLVVWVHGHGPYELNFPNIGQLKGISELVLRDADNLAQYQFHLLAVQCPKDKQWETTIGSSGDQPSYDSIDATIMIVEDLQSRLPIDPKRISAIGISSGGPACWEMVQRRPDLFAAVAPLACSLSASGRLRNLVDMPVWAFRSTADTNPPMSVTQATMAQLRSLGGSCLLTEVDTGSHDSWTTALLDYHLLDWLLVQRPGSADAPPPGSVNPADRLRLALRSCAKLGRWWPQLSVLIVAATVGWVIYTERSKCRRGPDAGGTAGA